VGFLAGLVLGPLVALAVLLTGHAPRRASAPPPDWETRLAEEALRASVVREAAGLASPVRATDENLLAGLRIYREDCAGCHGGRGRPSRWGTTSFYPRVPQLMDSPPDLTAPQMYLVVKHGVRYSGMAAWQSELSDEDIWRVAMLLSRLRSLPSSVEAAFKPRA
jgi:mono/diheme cytochrome c family protein